MMKALADMYTKANGKLDVLAKQLGAALPVYFRIFEASLAPHPIEGSFF